MLESSIVPITPKHILLTEVLVRQIRWFPAIRRSLQRRNYKLPIKAFLCRFFFCLFSFLLIPIFVSSSTPSTEFTFRFPLSIVSHRSCYFLFLTETYTVSCRGTVQNNPHQGVWKKHTQNSPTRRSHRRYSTGVKAAQDHSRSCRTSMKYKALLTRVFFFFVGILYFTVGLLKKENVMVIDLMVVGKWVVGVFQTSTFFR